MRRARQRATRVVVVLMVAAATVVVGAKPALAEGFDEQFASPALDPAWTVVPGAGNAYSLTANAGHLRYSVTAMTHEYGFLNGYAPAAPGEISCCGHDPGLEVYRPISGEHWLLEAKVDYFLPDLANGRALDLLVHFGPGSTGTYTAGWVRHRDTPCSFPCGSNTLSAVQWQQPGTTVGSLVRDGATLSLPQNGPALETYYLRIERDGGRLTWSYSTDNTTWNVLFAKDLGGALDGLAQRVTIAGHSWFVPAGSYADWDYVTVTPLELVRLSALLDEVESSDLHDALRNELANKLKWAILKLKQEPPDVDGACKLISDFAKKVHEKSQVSQSNLDLATAQRWISEALAIKALIGC